MLNNKQLGVVLWLFGFFLFAGHMFPHHYHPYREYIQDGLIVLGLMFSLCYMATVPKVTLSIPSLVILPLALGIVIVLQTINGLVLFPMDSFFPVIYLLIFAVSIIWGATISAQSSGLEKISQMLAWTYLIAGLISVLFQHIQLAGLNIPNVVMFIHDREKIRPFANIAQPNLLADILCFSLASTWWLFQAHRLNGRAALVLVLILCWGLALTQSRTAWIVLPMFVLVCALRFESDRIVSRVLLVGLLIGFAVMVVYTPALLKLSGVEVSTLGERASQTSVRILLWKQAWLISQLHPWFGAGWFQFGRYQVTFATIFPPSEYADNAHNLVLNLAAEIGWPLTIAVVGGMAYWLLKCCISRIADRHVRFIGLTLIAIIVHSMVEFPLWYGLILFPAGVMLGALHVDNLGVKLKYISRYWIVTFCSCALLFFVVASLDYYRLMLGFNALIWQQEGKTSGIGSIEKPEWTLYPQFYDYFKVTKIKIYPGMPPRDIDFLEQASLRFAYAPILSRAALAFAYNQRQDEALQVLNTIRNLQPNDYQDIYESYAGYAKDDPHYFGVIFQHMPKPVDVE